MIEKNITMIWVIRKGAKKLSEKSVPDTQMLDGQSSIMWVSYEGGGGGEEVGKSGRRDVGVPGGR